MGAAPGKPGSAPMPPPSAGPPIHRLTNRDGHLVHGGRAMPFPAAGPPITRLAPRLAAFWPQGGPMLSIPSVIRDRRRLLAERPRNVHHHPCPDDDLAVLPVRVG